MTDEHIKPSLSDRIRPNVEAAPWVIDEIRALEAAVQHESDCVEAAKAEIKALRAKIEKMEKQETVYLFRRKGLDDFCTCSKERYEAFSANPRLFEVKKLYALPGAQPAPNVPDGWQLVPIEPTEEMMAAGEKAEDDYLKSETGAWFGVKSYYRAVLAAAPKLGDE